MKLRSIFIGGLLVCVALACGVGVAHVFPSVAWRTQFMLAKAAGAMVAVEWGSVFRLVTDADATWHESPWISGNPYVAVGAPQANNDTVAAGREIYDRQCAACHGADGRSGSAPALVSGHLKLGASDLALFSTIRQGVPETPMAPSELGADDIWNVVAYLKQAIIGVDSKPPFQRAFRASLPAPGQPLSAETQDWSGYHGGHDGHRHSPLSKIHQDNVAELALDWNFDLRSGADSLQVTPLVVDGTMFVNLPDGEVWALDAVSGAVRWHRPGDELPRHIQRAVEGAETRGMAFEDSTLFVPTLDGQLLALSAIDGELLWRVTVADFREGYSVIGAPLAAGGRIVVGVAGGDRGVRGFLAGYASQDGRELWRFDTVPGSDRSSGEDRQAPQVRRRGGGLTSVTGTYDPRRNAIYWGVGNPSPAFEGDVRPGNNLYTSSVIALDADRGRLLWHFQVVPHDEWDWGVTQVPVLVDRIDSENPQDVLYIASRNGFLYVLDRANGHFIDAAQFAEQTWNEGFDPMGRPIERPYARPTLAGTLLWPGHAGATGWGPPAYDAGRDLLYLAVRNGYGNVFYKTPQLSWPDGSFWGGRAQSIAGSIRPAADTRIVAIDARSGQLRWSYAFPGTTPYAGGGMLSTAGGLVFSGEKNRFVALDADEGHELWHFETDGSIDAAPLTYLAGGEQRVAVTAGRSLLVFGLGTP